jgi:hypothetical protein
MGDNEITVENADKFSTTQPKTKLTKQSAVAKFDSLMTNLNLAVNTIEEEQITMDVFYIYAERLKNDKKGNGDAYAGSTLCEYMRKAKESIKDRFKKISFWVDDGGDDEVNKIADALEEQMKRQGNELGKEDDNFASLWPPDLLVTQTSILSGSEPNAFENADLVQETFNKMGRGGETRLCSHPTTKWEDYLQFEKSMWYEEKTAEKYPISSFPDRYYFVPATTLHTLPNTLTQFVPDSPTPLPAPNPTGLISS